jgi:hypothetical protein
MKKQDISVESLVGMIERGELQLPEIQRRYVWRAPRVRDLLDSLYRGYPSGSILLWETDQDVPVQNLAIQSPSTPFLARKLLLDGQQRLTSLAAIIRGQPVTVRGRKKPIDILFNLDHPEGPPVELAEVVSDEEDLLEEEVDDNGDGEDEEDAINERLKQRTFVVASKALAQQPNWVSVSRVFKESDKDILTKAGVKDWNDPRFDLYTKRLNRVRQTRDYSYVVNILERELSYEEVAEIFVRVNSLGMKLRSSDLALAQITARWPNSLKVFQEFQEECEDSWFSLDLGLLIRTMVVFASQQCKFAGVGGLPIENLKTGWKQTKEGIRYALNFLRTNADLPDESLLSSPNLILPLAVYSRLKNNALAAKETKELLYWLHVANLRGRYSRGSMETLLNEDLSILFKGGGPSDLLPPIQRLFGKFHVEPLDLAGRPARSPLFPITFLALRAAGAKDWRSGLGVSLTHQGKLHFVEYHHIFPKSVLKKEGYETGEINEIANMAFISGDTNRRISAKVPHQYFPEIMKEHGEKALASQCIPLDPTLHHVENYREFLKYRREALAKAINAHLERAKTA